MKVVCLSLETYASLPVEKKELAYFIDRCADAVGAVVSEGLAAAQNRFH